MRRLIAGLFAIMILFMAGCASDFPMDGEIDVHGCHPAGGYKWCPSTQRCQIMWDEYCEEYASEFRGESNITSFEECAAAGNPVMKSKPPKCNADGHTFVQGIEESAEDESPIIGGERDEHGCLVAAGYGFSDDAGACVRSWELNDDAVRAARIAIGQVGFEFGTTIIEVAAPRCPGCFEVVLEKGIERVQTRVSIADWQVVERSFATDECMARGGVVKDASGGETCGDYEMYLGLVTGTEAKSICCVPKEGSDGLSFEQALAIASVSECADKGTFGTEYIYNPNSRTWWIDIDMDAPGCSPACVISEDTKTAEINWRCTGLVQD